MSFLERIEAKVCHPWEVRVHPSKGKHSYDVFNRCVELLHHAPAGLLLAGVAFLPVAGNGIAGAGKPFLVAAELFQRFGGEEFGAVRAGGPTASTTCCNKHGNFVRFETEKPSSLYRIEPRRNDLPTQKNSVCCAVIFILDRRLGDAWPFELGEWAWVCFSEAFCSVARVHPHQPDLGLVLVRSRFSLHLALAAGQPPFDNAPRARQVLCADFVSILSPLAASATSYSSLVARSSKPGRSLSSERIVPCGVRHPRGITVLSRAQSFRRCC